MELSQIILGPVITEKSIDQQKYSRYTFLVAPKATKKEVKKAVEKYFEVDVLDIRVINIRGKKVRFGKKKTPGRTKDKRKAVVTIKKDQKIDIFEIGEKK